MDQKKIGNFLKELRLNKNLTQEELALKFYVSTRTISRWETGVNLPDIVLLIDLANFYNVDVREIIEGEFINKMNDNEKDVATKVATYANDKNEKSYKKIFKSGIIGLVAFTVFFILMIIGFDKENGFIDIMKGLTLGIGIGTLIYITLYSCDVLPKIKKIKWLYISIKVFCIVIIVIFLLTMFATYAWFTEV